MGEKITITAGTSINDGDHEDGDELIPAKNLTAEVVGVVRESGSLRVVIPAIDKDRVFFIHQPTEKKKV